MENKKIFNSIFENKNYLSRLKKTYLELSNKPIKKKENLNIFTKTIRIKYPHNSKSQPIEPLQKNIKKSKRGKIFNMLSCPDEKYSDFNQKYINIMQSKLFKSKGIKSIITQIKYKDIKNGMTKRKEGDENNKLSIYHKENKFGKFINHIQENQTLYSPFYVNKNISIKCNNKFNDCLQIVPIIPEKTEGNSKNKNELKDKMRLTSNNSWFRKTMTQNIKGPFLPKMKKLNEKIKKEKDQIKTFFNMNKYPGQHSLSIYDFKKNFKAKNKIKNKYKNIISFEIYSLPGTEKFKQKINQDAYLVMPNVNNTHNAKIFGIFDGHGINGDKLSQEIRDYFIEFFSDKKKYEKEIDINSYESNIKDENLEKIYKYMSKENYKELTHIFEDINSKLHEKYKQDDFCLKSGSTSNILMLFNDKKSQILNKIISINLGDSKSILINEENNIIELNKRHTPNDLEEKERIEKNGGEISRVDWADYGPMRIFYKNKRYPGLSMTRAFGDFNAEALGFNTFPDIKEYDIYEQKPKIIISATDGIWQFLSNEQVKNIILPYYEEDNITGGIQKLVTSARRMWETMNPKFIDDITIILLFFK